METKPLELTHLVREPLAGAGSPPLLVLLHGFGSNEYDLFSMAPYLDGRFLIVSARAPFTLQPGSYAWFDLGITPTEVLIDPRQADLARNQIIRFVGEAVAAYGADARQVYLMGFSQGAMMSAAVALTRPELVAGVVMMSGRVPPELLPLLAPRERLVGLPFLVIHGTLDPLLPVEHGRASHGILTSLPVDLVYQEYPMGHEVNADSFATVASWLTDRLARAKGA